MVAAAMSGAAEEIAATEPPYWDAEIVEVDQRTFDIAVLTVRTDEPVPYLAGQSLALEPTHHPSPGVAVVHTGQRTGRSRHRVARPADPRRSGVHRAGPVLAHRGQAPARDRRSAG